MDAVDWASGQVAVAIGEWPIASTIFCVGPAIGH